MYIYDYVIVGAGLAGSICAYELQKRDFKVCVIEKRNHIGGNCYTERRDNIDLHMYGPHIFHTSDVDIWNYVNKFATFDNFILNVVANYRDELYSLPFNMWTFNKLYGLSTPEDVKMFLKTDIEPSNLEEQAIKMVGKVGYEKLIKGYTIKQWKKHPSQLPKEIIQRLPIRFTYDGNYFNDYYQGIPREGYTHIFQKLLKAVEVRLNCTELPEHKNLIYTGAIDKYFDYKYGSLEYKTVKLDNRFILSDNYQGCPVMNYTDENVEHTRCIEHKHFSKNTTTGTWISLEYPTVFNHKTSEPYYPVNDSYNMEILRKYQEEAKTLPNVYFIGRLAEYKYYDMDKVIKSTLNMLAKMLF